MAGTEAIGGNDASLKAQAQQRSAQSGISETLRTSVLDGTYSEQMHEAAAPLLDCAEKNRNSLAANGTVTGCGDEGAQNVVRIVEGASQADAACTGERQCKRWGQSVQTFTRTCTRTVQLTERITSYRYDTLTCTVTTTTPLEGPSITTNSCDGQNPDPRNGMSHIGTGATSCVSTDETTGTCLASEYPMYYASQDPEVTGVADSPVPVAGACDPSLGSETQFVSYSKGNWFGRTRPDNECVVSLVDELDNSPVGIIQQLTYVEKDGCGVYTAPDVGRTCYGKVSSPADADSCTGMDLNGCSIVSSAPSKTTGPGGLTTAFTDTYQCRRSQQMCQEWSSGEGDNSCLNAQEMTFGTDVAKAAYNDGSGMNAALVASAILDATAEGVDGNSNPFVPLLFSGEDMRCTRATGGIGQIFGRNCCRTDLQRPIVGNIIRDGCKMPHVELAAARRSNYTVYIGDYCSKKMKFPSRCLERTETYCSFNGILPRLIHEQGRGQLAQIAASSYGADVLRGALNFTYLDAADGSWSPTQVVNGVSVSAWRWPSYCKDAETFATRLASDPYALDCPSVVHTVVASCDSPGGCGALPTAPEYGSAGWNLVNVDPLSNVSTAVSRYGVVTGACSTSSGNCAYQIAAWPAGKGGKAVITRDISWPLFAEQNGQSVMDAGGVSQMSNMSDLMFRTWSSTGLTDGKTMPGSVRVDYSNDGGQSWNTSSVPTANNNQDYILPGTDIRMNGRCDALTNICAFRVTGTLTIHAKPWGGPKRPDCTGFTGGQLSAMDFGKMDLSEWLASVMETAADAAPTELAEAASEQFKDFNSLFQEGKGTVTMAVPTAANYARVTPSQGFGPFNVRVIAGGYWPHTTGDPAKDTNAVYRVDVDWGDCTQKETLAKLDPRIPASAFVGYHRFEAPDKLRCGAATKNVTQVITLTVYTKDSGVQTRKLSVENAWSVFPGGTGNNNDNVRIEVTVPVNQGVPTAPSSTVRN